MNRLVLLCVLLLSQSTMANIVLGTFGPPIDRVRESKTSTQGTFSLRPYVGLFYRHLGTYPFSFNFELDYVFPQTSYSGMQEPVSKNRKIIAQIDMDYFLYQDLVYGIAGLSTVATKVYGDGAQVNVAGNDFYLPGQNGDSSYNTLVNLGVGLNYNYTYFAELKAHIWEILNSQSRAVSISFALKARFF